MDNRAEGGRTARATLDSNFLSVRVCTKNDKPRPSRRGKQLRARVTLVELYVFSILPDSKS